MSLAPIQTAGLLVVGASSAVSAVTGQSAKFAGLVRSKLRSVQPGALSPAQSSARQLHLPDGSQVDIGQLRASAKSDLKQIQSRLTAAAAQNGIDISGGVSLQIDANGAAHVSGPNPQQSAINTLIAADSQLDSLVASAAQKARILQAADGVSGSGNAAQQTFETALASLSGPLSTATLSVSPRQTSMTVSQGG
jgi:hypothetical protein